LRTDEAEELDRPGSRGSEPVRGTGVEFGDFSWFEDEVILAEHQAEPAVEDVHPVVALMGTQRGRGVVVPGAKDELVCLDAAAAARERNDRRSVVAGDWT
jgi:hypothetical protein